MDPPVSVDDPADALVDALAPEPVELVIAPVVVAVPADALSLLEPPPLQPKTRASDIMRDTLGRIT